VLSVLGLNWSGLTIASAILRFGLKTYTVILLLCMDVLGNSRGMQRRGIVSSSRWLQFVFRSKRKVSLYYYSDQMQKEEQIGRARFMVIQRFHLEPAGRQVATLATSCCFPGRYALHLTSPSLDDRRNSDGWPSSNSFFGAERQGFGRDSRWLEVELSANGTTSPGGS